MPSTFDQQARKQRKNHLFDFIGFARGSSGGSVSLIRQLQFKKTPKKLICSEPLNCERLAEA
jgi:hypothetical protein